jgi:hypothetical protein
LFQYISIFEGGFCKVAVCVGGEGKMPLKAGFCNISIFEGGFCKVAVCVGGEGKMPYLISALLT